VLITSEEWKEVERETLEEKEVEGKNRQSSREEEESEIHHF
jgi:hypothetical protein